MKITKKIRAARDVQASYSVVLKDGDLIKKDNGDNRISYVSKPIIKLADSPESASRMIRDFIEEHNLGASTFTGGIVLDDEARPAYVISYNGKVTPFQEFIDRWGTGIITNSRVLKGLDYKPEDFVQNAIDDGIEASEDKEWYIVDTPLDNRSDEWWANEEKKRLARELADEEDFYDLEHGEGQYADDIDSCDQIQATSTRERISNLEQQIADLENRIAKMKAAEADEDQIIDYQLYLDELKDELNFAWQDDEAEYNYALEQQEFNPDGSLKYYDDIHTSEDVECSEDDECPNCHYTIYNKYTGNTWGRFNTYEEAKAAFDEEGCPSYLCSIVQTDWDGDDFYASTDVSASQDITASDIIPNKKIQVGMVWHIDWHELEVKSISKDHKTCKVTEDWIAEDTGKEVHKVHKYNIATDKDGQEYIWHPDSEEYANPGQDDYKWWARIYATGADNYPWTDEDVEEYEDPSEYEDDEDEYTPSATAGDYSPSNPWDAPGMSIRDFI